MASCIYSKAFSRFERAQKHLILWKLARAVYCTVSALSKALMASVYAPVVIRRLPA